MIPTTKRNSTYAEWTREMAVVRDRVRKCAKMADSWLTWHEMFEFQVSSTHHTPGYPKLKHLVPCQPTICHVHTLSHSVSNHHHLPHCLYISFEDPSRLVSL